MRKTLLSILALAFFAFSASSQNRTIIGKVTDEKGKPLPGVTITIKGTSSGTATGLDGTYTIALSDNAKVLLFSALNMATEEIAIGSKKVIYITMKSVDKALEEVVVTGYSREKKSQFTGAATKLSSKAVETVPVGAFDQALQGRVPGMVVSSGSGQPGNSANITIRGIQSISGAGVQPLYVLDGVPIPASDMQTINPNDFESITILKDAGAAALYGARGGLGVIVITTKKGKAGATSFTYRTQMGFTQAPNPSKFNMMNTAEALAYEESAGLAGAAIAGPGWAYSKKNPTYATQLPSVQARRDFLLDSFSKIQPNFYDILFRQGVSQTHDINVSGGTDKTRYYLSAGMFDQKGTDLNSRLRRYTTRFNLDQTVGKLLVQFNTQIGYSITNYNEGEWLGNSARNPFQIVWRAKPYENPYAANGTPIFGASTTLAPKVIGNTLEGIANSYWQNRQVKANSGLTLAYKLFPSITLKNTVGIDMANDLGLRSINANSYIGSLQTFNSGFHTEAYTTRTQLINTTSAVFTKRFALHEVEAGAYFEVVRGYQRGLGFQLWNLDPRLTLTGQGAGALPLGAGATTYPQNASSAKSGFGIRSYFSTARYTYNNRYTISGNVRRDGTSRIANEANKEINTWSVGASWEVMKENFMRNQNFITEFTIRGSYGQVPNIGSISTGGYGISGGLFGITNYLGPQLPTFGTSTAFLGSAITGQAPTTPGNPNLKIETIEKLNIGTDFSFWDARARFKVELYSNITNDLFVSQPLGSTTGFGGTSLPINAGKMSNKGIEMAVDVDVVKTKNFGLTIGFNHAINKNKIEDLGLVSEYPQGTGIIRKGLPFGSHYTQHYLGADAATGRPTYKKADGTVTNDIAQAGLFADFGTYLPKHVGGFTADITFHKITVSALFSYQFDVYRYNNIESWTTRGTSGFANAVNQNKILFTEQWQKPGDVKYYASPLYDRGFTSADVHDAKFLRFRNLNISYAIPTFSINKKPIIKSARFYVQGQNLWIWSPWRGLDPEDSNNISLNEFPNPRMIVTGIDINF
jgi:TonB-linked SusC/RagA family outer membrane protein